MAGPEDYPEICGLYGTLVRLLEEALEVKDDLEREELAVRRCLQFLSYMGVKPHLLDPLRDIADRNRYELNKRWYSSRVRHPSKMRKIAKVAALAYASHKLRGITIANAIRDFSGWDGVTEEEVKDFRKRLTRKDGRASASAASFFCRLT